MKNTLIAFTLIGVSAAHASSCGDWASGVYNLTNDLTCAGNGLYVGASNTTINLNGHTIKCIGNGSQGSCQATTSGGGGGKIGIWSWTNHQVTVNGPGTVSGFSVGISISDGYGHSVNGVTVTGPAAKTLATNDKDAQAGVDGINLHNVQCHAGISVTGLPSDGLPTQIVNNEVLNQTRGLFLYNSACVTATGNNIHNNSGVPNGGHSGGVGVVLANSSRVNLYSNQVNSNGANLELDGGIMLLGAGTANNVLYGNTANYNCGYGIWGYDGIGTNNVIANHARFNGQSTTDGKCAAPQPGHYTDLASFSQGAGNSWNPNNQCRTQSGQVPAGVCNPAE